MKKLFSIILCLMLVCSCALAENGGIYVADTDNGQALITRDGRLLTEPGAYDVILPITYDDCPPERQLFAVSVSDLDQSMFIEDVSGEVDWDDDWAEGDDWVDNEDFGADSGDGSEWLDVPEDVEEWPEGDGGLDDGYDMEVVEDEEWPEELEGGDDWGDIGGFEDPFADSGLEDDYFDYGMTYAMALMNAEGRLLTGFDYISFDHDVDNRVVTAYDFNGFASMLSENGAVLAAGPYTSIVSDTAGGYFAIMPSVDEVTGDFSVTAPIVRITSAGEVIETGVYTYSYELLPGFSGGFMCVASVDKSADGEAAPRYMYINTDGADAFGAGFAYAGDFMGGCAEVYDESYVARLINKNGEYAADAGYSYFEFGADESAPVIGNLIDGGFDIISTSDGSIIASLRPENGAAMLYAFHSGDGLIMAFSDKEMLVLDMSGNVLYRGESDAYAYTWYEHADSQPARLLMTSGEGYDMRTCVADFAGNQTSGWYQEITALSWSGDTGRYLVGSYDMIEVEYDDVTGYEPDPGTCRYGVIDQDGNVIVEQKYEYFVCLDADRYWACDESAYVLMDASGSVLASFAR